MLTVIVIIGILASLITAAVIHARAGVKVFTVRKEISDLQQAMEAYKIKYGEYPPDFSTLFTNPSLQPVCRPPLGSAVAVLRHLQSAYPRYFETNLLPLPNDIARWDKFRADVSDPNTGYPGLDPEYFTPATALVFWLGGLPEQLPGTNEKWVPAGFHADKANPFKRGLPRTEPFFTFNGKSDGKFNGERLEPWPGNAMDPPKYYPPSVEAPYVYFRARRDLLSVRFEYGVMWDDTTCNPFTYRYGNADNACVPYMDGVPTAQNPRPWCEQQKYQIIAAGLSDGLFGSAAAGVCRNLTTGDGITNADFDNLTSFADGKLEDAMPK